MAEYRVVKMCFWNDTKVQDELSPEDKYFYLYLLTNPYTNLCGCYELSLNKAAIELGYNKETIVKLINRFVNDYKLICYSESTKEVLIINWAKNNWSASPKYITSVEKVINQIKEDKYKAYLSSILSHYKINKDFVDMTSILYSDTTVVAAVEKVEKAVEKNEENSLQNNEATVELTEEELYEKETNKKDYKTLIRWTNTWVVNEEVRQLLMDWLTVMIANHKFMTLKTYRNKLDLLYSDCENNHELITQSIRNSIEGGWMAFYKPKRTYVKVNTAQNSVKASKVNDEELDLSEEVF